jgi:hypothetical protein
MRWLILAIFAEVSVLLCLIFAFDGALHSLSSARITWDHVAVSALYAAARMHFSWRRLARPSDPARATAPSALRPAA